MNGLIEWFTKHAEIVSKYPSQIATFLVISVGATWVLAWWFAEKTKSGEINSLKETNKFLELRVQELQSKSWNSSLDPQDIIALKIIANQAKNSNDFFAQHTAPESLATQMGITVHEANEIILALKGRGLVHSEAYRNSYPMIGRSIDLSHPVVITTRGLKTLEKLQ